jgi:ferritin-like metal-binding protein YciE
MRLFDRTELNTLDDLFLWSVQDLYDCELRIVDALPTMIEAAQNPELKEALQSHFHETKRQVTRLEQIFRELGKEPERATCGGIKGIISEGEDIVGMSGDADVKDAALIGACQRVEHYEIAAYGTARTFAERLGYGEAVTALQMTLQEETDADSTLTKVAEGVVNVRAQHV